MKYNADTLRLIQLALDEIKKINDLLDEAFPFLKEGDGIAINGGGSSC